MSEPRREKCIWCAGDDGPLTTIDVPVDTEFPAGDPKLEEVAVHPRHASQAREYLFAFARYAMRDMLIVIFLPVLMVAAVPLGQLFAGWGGSEWAWRVLICGTLLASHAAYVVLYPYTMTPRRLSMKIGGLRRGRKVVRAVAGTVAFASVVGLVLVFA